MSTDWLTEWLTDWLTDWLHLERLNSVSRLLVGSFSSNKPLRELVEFETRQIQLVNLVNFLIFLWFYSKLFLSKQYFKIRSVYMPCQYFSEIFWWDIFNNLLIFFDPSDLDGRTCLLIICCTLIFSRSTWPGCTLSSCTSSHSPSSLYSIFLSTKKSGEPLKFAPALQGKFKDNQTLRV